MLMTISSGMLVFLIALGAVGLFVLGMSLTIIFKGHYMDSEIGTNRHMQERGIRCASQQIREEELSLRGTPNSDCASASCVSCATPCAQSDLQSAEADPHSNIQR